MHGDQMADPDALWARDGSQDQVIKSDLDNFSAKKSAKDQNEEKENHDLEMQNLQEELKVADQIDSQIVKGIDGQEKETTK